MRHLFLWFFLFVEILNADSFHFKEERYIHSLNKNIKYEGDIHFKNEKVTIHYEKPNPSMIVFLNNTITIQNQDSVQKISNSDNPGIVHFFTIIQAIHKNDTNKIQNFFDIKKEKDVFILTPKNTTKKYIHLIKYKKNDQFLKYLLIEMKNEDRIQIHVLD